MPEMMVLAGAVAVAVTAFAVSWTVAAVAALLREDAIAYGMYGVVDAAGAIKVQMHRNRGRWNSHGRPIRN